MIHRHLDIPEGTPVEELGPAAIDDLLDRGDLGDWRPLAEAVAADPHGRLAGVVLNLCNAHPMYGTSELWRLWIGELKATARDEPAPAGLAELRRSQGLSQTRLGERLGISQSDVSKLERRGEVRISTLREVVSALGGTLRMVAEFADGTSVTLAPGSQSGAGDAPGPRGSGRAQQRAQPAKGAQLLD
ncbi:MAG: helix-turn-helix domain-containing protein [Actinomycetota bacterium]